MFEYGLGVSQSDIRAALWIERAAIAGFDRAQYNMGKRYRDGNGVDQDLEMAARWFLAAARQGYAKAQNHIGVRYMRGEGVPQDNVEALKWLTLAAEQGHGGATATVEELSAQMTLEERAESQARAEAFIAERANVY